MFGNKWFGVVQPFYETADLGGGGGGGSTDGTTAAIEASIAGLEGTDGEDGGDPKAAAKPEVADDEAAEEAEIAKIQQELRAKNPKMAGSIAVDRHQAVLTRARNKAQQEMQAAVEKAKAEHEAALAEALKEFEWAKDPQARVALDAFTFADQNPKQFIQALLTDPRFAEIIALKEAQEAASSTSAPSDFPAPNKRTDDGYEYYDQEGLKALLAYNESRAVAKAKEEMMREFGPVKEKYEIESQWAGAVERSRRLLNEAREGWDRFKELEPKIGELMRADKKISLDAAYRKVYQQDVAERLKAAEAAAKTNEAELRKKILAELGYKQKAASAGEKPGAAPEREVKDGPQDIEDTIRASIANLPRD